MTKTAALQALRDAMKPHGHAPRTHRVEAHVYSDIDHMRRGRAHHDSLAGDFIAWGRLSGWLELGRVVDLFIYEKVPGGWGELLDAYSVQLQQLDDGSIVAKGV